MRRWRSAARASESVTGEELDLDAFVPGPGRSVDDAIAAAERVRRSAEALRALKPDEAKALMMKANGLSYDEIGERYGWSYTKVNRAITEGRRRFLARYEGIESGEECERFAPVVEALAGGTATARADRLDPAAPASLHRLPRGGPRPAPLPRPPRLAVLAGLPARGRVHAATSRSGCSTRSLSRARRSTISSPARWRTSSSASSSSSIAHRRPTSPPASRSPRPAAEAGSPPSPPSSASASPAPRASARSASSRA